MEYFCAVNTSDWLAGFAIVIAGLSLWVTIRSNIVQRRRENDKELLNQLALTLKRAFESIAPDNEDYNPKLIQDRLAWLACSRHLLSYRDMKSGIKTKLYRRLREEHEEFWRHEFYKLLQEIGSSESYKCDKWDGRGRHQTVYIEPTSAAVIHGFSAWPENQSDPIDSVSFGEEVKRGNLFGVQYRNFRKYIMDDFPHLYQEGDGDDG